MARKRLSPIERYQTNLEQPGFLPDPVQAAIVDKLDDLYQRLNQPAKSRSGIQRWLPWGKVEQVPEQGLYIWGGVGRGKTYLMDLFYESLPFKNKMRAHFHRFMRRVHQELKTLSGQQDPLEIIATRLRKEAKIICFDEFFVSDITDAMLLGTLFEALFARGMTLVATSNIEPDNLYQNGLQRARFLPAIALINQHTEVVYVDSDTDYRLRALEQAELYHSPLDDQAEASLQTSFESVVPDIQVAREDFDLEVEGRPIRARKICEDVIWFDFVAVCEGPRSQNDYVELAQEFHTVLLSNVPIFKPYNQDALRRFISLVDEFYDRNVKLILSAAAPLEKLFEGGSLHFEFERTQSRLLEMQSRDYLAQPHKP